MNPRWIASLIATASLGITGPQTSPANPTTLHPIGHALASHNALLDLDNVQTGLRAVSFATGQRTAPFQSSSGPTETPLFRCGTDMLLPEPILLTWETVVLASDGQQFTPCLEGMHTLDHREAREWAVLRGARGHPDSELRRLAAQAIGRTGGVESLGPPRRVSNKPVAENDTSPMERLLNDESKTVRLEAANAIGEYLSGVPRELQPSQRHPSEHVGTGRFMLEKRFTVESDDEVAGVILETLGRLRYSADASSDEIETFLIMHARGAPARILGATKGLEALVRGNPKRKVSPAARETLRRLAVTGPTTALVPTIAGLGTPAAPGDPDKLARSRRLALLALQQAHDDDIETVIRAAADADWQVRRLVALQLDFARPELKPIIAMLLNDPAFQVRYEVLAPVARYVARTKDCALLVGAFEDPEPTVVLRAIDLLPEVCAAHEVGIKRLVAWAEELRTPLDPRAWHRPAHALEALARLRVEAASPLLKYGAAHQIWQVRARTAAAAISLKNESVVRGLTADREPNVRTAALESLVTLTSPAVFQAAIQALENHDFQLVRAAAIALRGTPEAERVNAVKALLGTLRRLTQEAADTSRDPRVAILERLGEILPLERTEQIAVFREDFDDKVRQAAAAALTRLTGTESRPAYGGNRRYPLQPSPEELTTLPKAAVITMEGGGRIELKMLIDQAPITIARFAQLARAGYYNDLTFHRVVPNHVIQGGSPAANEYGGVARYMRDEIGTEPHTRGAVGISTRGRDTGDAQIFIDLVDNPRVDHKYTVFARVVAGLDVVERILEGARMTSVTVK